MSSQVTTAQAIGGEVQSRTRREIATPDGVAFTVAVADLGSRLAAAMIDVFIILFVSTSLVILFLLLIGVNLFTGDGVTFVFRYGGLAFALISFVNFLIRLLYFPALEYARRGQTIGKSVLGLRVIDRRGGPLTLEAVIARNVLREIEFWLPVMVLLMGGGIGRDVGTNLWAMLFLGCVAILPFTNKERMRGGDMLAGTWVIAEPRIVLLPELSRQTGGFSRLELGHYGVKELEVLAGVLRENRPHAEELRRNVADRIRKRIGVDADTTIDDKQFLENFYSALREHLERQKIVTGHAPADKSATRAGTPTGGTQVEQK